MVGPCTVATWAHHEKVFEANVNVVISTHSMVAPAGSSDATPEAGTPGNDCGGAETGGGKLGIGGRDTVGTAGTDSDSGHGVTSPGFLGVGIATGESALDAVAFHPLVGTMDQGIRDEVKVSVGRAPDVPVPVVSSHGIELP